MSRLRSLEQVEERISRERSLIRSQPRRFRYLRIIGLNTQLGGGENIQRKVPHPLPAAQVQVPVHYWVKFRAVRLRQLWRHRDNVTGRVITKIIDGTKLELYLQILLL